MIPFIDAHSALAFQTPVAKAEQSSWKRQLGEAREVMFHVSKILWALLQPSSLIAILLAAGVVMAARGKRSALPIFLFAAAFYLIGGFSPVANWLLVPLEQRAQAGAADTIDGAAGIIVLGGGIAGVRDSGGKTVGWNEATSRMIEAVQLAQQYQELPVIFSGGKDENDKESQAEVARRFLERFKITPPRLRLEDRSRNTLENAVFTAKMVQPRPDQRWILVTSAFHMQRARALFEAQGFRIIPHPVDFRTSGPADLWQIFWKPSDGLRRLDMAAKEWVGLWVSWLRGTSNGPRQTSLKALDGLRA